MKEIKLKIWNGKNSFEPGVTTILLMKDLQIIESVDLFDEEINRWPQFKKWISN